MSGADLTLGIVGAVDVGIQYVVRFRLCKVPQPFLTFDTMLRQDHAAVEEVSCSSSVKDSNTHREKSRSVFYELKFAGRRYPRSWSALNRLLTPWTMNTSTYTARL